MRSEINIPALVALVVFVAGGIGCLALGYEAIGAGLIGAALGQMGPQPVKRVAR